MKVRIFLLITGILMIQVIYAQHEQKITPEIKTHLNEYYDAQEQGDPAKGIKALTFLIEADPQYAPYYSARASIRMYMHDTSTELILQDLSSAILNDSNNIEYYKTRASYYKSILGEENFLAGVHDCEKILSMDSTYFPAYRQMHIYYMYRDTKAASVIRKQAQFQMHKLVERDSLLAENWFNLAESYSLLDDQYETTANKEKALSYYSKAIVLDSTRYTYYWERAMKYYWYKKDYAACLKDMQRILQLNSVYIYYEYESLCYEKLGEKDKALEAVNTGLNIFPGQSNLLEQKAHLEKKKKSNK